MIMLFYDKPEWEVMEKDIKQIALQFHNTYEELAPKFGYETRKDTRELDFNSENGQLMYATVQKVVKPIIEKLEKAEEENENLVLSVLNNKKYIDNECIPKSIIREEIEKLERDAEKIREKKKDANDYDRSKARMQAYLTKTNEIKKRLEELLGDEQ